MKRVFLLCAMIGAAFVLGGCANQNSSATASDTTHTTRRGLVDAGSVAPVSGGPARPTKNRFQP